MDILRPRDETGKFLPMPPSPTAISGIYQITNTITCDFYIGSSANIKRRWQEHRKCLRKGNHGCIFLQRAWTKYGEDAFVFSILEAVPHDKHALLERERHYIQMLSPRYNIADPVLSHLGLKRSEETKAKLRNRQISEEQREKLRQANTGRKVSPETLEKMRQVQIERYANLDPEARQAHREKRIGQKLTPEQREKQLAIMRSPEYREKQRQAHAGKEFTLEHCANISKAKMGHYTSPETIARMNATRLQTLREKKERGNTL